MALYHFHVDQVKRSEGCSAVASAAYRAGEKLHNLWDGETHDYTKKGGVVFTEIMLPPRAVSFCGHDCRFCISSAGKR